MKAALMTFTEVRDHLRISDNTLRGILDRGELRAGKIGAHWRIRSDDLESYLDRTWNEQAIGAQRANEAIAKVSAHRPARKASADALPFWEKSLVRTRAAKKTK